MSYAATRYISRHRRIAIVLGALLPMTLAACSSGGSSSSTTTASSTKPTGSSGTVTLKVGGFGNGSFFSGSEIGAEARFQRFNNTNEMPGVKIEFTGFSDDQGSPSVALSNARQLITQDHVFAIVPDMSTDNPTAYMTAQKTPWIGWGIDSSYCSTTGKPTTSIWGFGVWGCSVAPNPPVVPDTYGQLYQYVTKTLGVKSPSIELFSNDTASGIASVKQEEHATNGAGFRTFTTDSAVPTGVTDWTPYVQSWLKADNGKAPTAIGCLGTTACVPAYAAVKAAGYTGTFDYALGPIAALAPAMAGAVTAAFYNASPNPGLTQMTKDIDTFKPGTAISSTSNVPTYFAADMFIQALEKVGKANLTQANVQKALSTITYGIKGKNWVLVGPTDYSKATVVTYPFCQEMFKATATGYTSLAPYACSTKQYSTGS